MLTVGQKFPPFSCQAASGMPQDVSASLTHESFPGQWVVYFFYPRDLTFICLTEIAEFGRHLSEFHERGAALVGGSGDPGVADWLWLRANEHLQGLRFPLLAAQQLATDLGIVDPRHGGVLRATYIVNAQGTILWATAYGFSVGRNVLETLRVLDALQSDELCPCNWQPADPYIADGESLPDRTERMGSHAKRIQDDLPAGNSAHDGAF